MGFKCIRRLVRDLRTSEVSRRRDSGDRLTDFNLRCFHAGLRTRSSVLRVCRNWHIVRFWRRLGGGSRRRRVLDLRRQRGHLSCRRSWSRNCRS